jgi:hypothetical protein
MVPAPTASDLPKKERRLIELVKGLNLSSELSSRVWTVLMDDSFPLLGFDVEVVANDAVSLLIGFMLETSDDGCVCRNGALVRFCAATYELTLPPSFGIGDYPTSSAVFLDISLSPAASAEARNKSEIIGLWLFPERLRVCRLAAVPLATNLSDR